MYGLRITTEPSIEPITLAQAKLHCSVASSVTNWDSLITSMIVAARKYAEEYTHRSFITTEWEFVIDQLDYDDLSLLLPISPLQSVDSFSYVDQDGTTQVWSAANYIVSTSREPGRLSLGFQKL